MKMTMILCLMVAISMVTADDYSDQDNPNYYQSDSQVDINTKYHIITDQPTSKHVKVITPCPLYKYGFYEDPSDCGAFFQCSPAGLVRTKCAKGTLYDRNIQRCNTKEFVTCYSGVSCPHPFGLFPDPRFCNKFLNCFKNIPYVQACPAGLVFNAVAPGRGFCDYPKNVHCGGKEIDVIKVHKPVIVTHPVHVPVVKKPVHKVVVDKRPVHKVVVDKRPVHKVVVVKRPIHKVRKIVVVKRPVVEHPIHKPVIVKHPVYTPVEHPKYTPVVKEPVRKIVVVKRPVIEHPIYTPIVRKPVRKIIVDKRPIHEVRKIVVKRPVVEHPVYKPVIVKHKVDNRRPVEHPIYTPIVKKPIRKIVVVKRPVVEHPVYTPVVKHQVDNRPVIEHSVVEHPVEHPIYTPIVKKPVRKIIVDKRPIHEVSKIVVRRPVVEHPVYTPVVKHQVDNRPVIEHTVVERPVEHPIYNPIVKKPVRKIVTYIQDERPVHIRPRYDNDD